MISTVPLVQVAKLLNRRLELGKGSIYHFSLGNENDEGRTG
jgi:hypothetical protein